MIVPLACITPRFGRVHRCFQHPPPSRDHFRTQRQQQPPATKDGSLGLGLELVAGRDSLDMEFTSAMERDLWYTAFCYLSRYLASPAELALRDAEDQLRETRRDLADCRKEIEVVSCSFRSLVCCLLFPGLNFLFIFLKPLCEHVPRGSV